MLVQGKLYVKLTPEPTDPPHFERPNNASMLRLPLKFKEIEAEELFGLGMMLVGLSL